MNPSGKLAAYAVVLALALGGGAAAGAVLGPDPDDDAPVRHPHAAATHDAGGSASLPGLAISDQGYTLAPESTVLPEAGGSFRFRILGPDGHAVRAFEVEHAKELHLIVASRDLERFAHVHPERDADGTWSVTLPAMPAGAYRVFADFRPEGGPALTLGADAIVPGDHRVPAPRGATDRSVVDGFEVELVGTPRPGDAVPLVVRVSVDGRPARLEPYLGANGHLVALRDGDLAYLHVHPEHADAPDEVPFMVSFPSPGRYRLFFDFQVDGVVRTADFTVDVGTGGDAAHDAPHDASDDAPEQDGHR